MRPAGRARRWSGALFHLPLGILIALCALLLDGCAVVLPQSEAIRAQWPADVAEHAEIDAVPFFPQQDYQCGPAALATVLAFRGALVTPQDLVSAVYLPARRGSLQVELLAAARRYGMVSMALAPRLDDLLREVQAGNPVIVLQNYGVGPVAYWHYAVVVGFDRAANRVMLRSGETRRLEMPFAALEYTWKESGYWAMVAAPPERIPVTATEQGWLAAVVASEQANARASGSVPSGPVPSRPAYAAALRRWPDSQTAAVGLANALYADGDLAAAESVLRSALQRHPGAAVLLNNLAQVVSDQHRHAEALRLIDEAIRQGGSFSAAAQATREQIRDRMRPGDASPRN